jgi:hypothetical protein
VVLFIALVLAMREEEKAPLPPPLLSYTQQELDKSLTFSAGLKSDDVKKVMGDPIKKEFVGGKEEWHYCRTGELVDEYLALRFSEGILTEMEQYTVSALDVVYHHTPTPSSELADLISAVDCRFTVRWGSYGQRMPQGFGRTAAQQGAPADVARPAGERRG